MPSFDSVKSSEIWVHQDKVVSEDDFLGILQSDKATHFIDLKGKAPYDEPKVWYPGDIIRVYINLSKDNTSYFRRVYTLLDAFGDAGGLLESIMIIVGLLVSPIYFKI